MFFCDPCGEILGWGKGYGLRSYGRCEMCECGPVACNDIPSKVLPTPSEKAFEELRKRREGQE